MRQTSTVEKGICKVPAITDVPTRMTGEQMRGMGLMGDLQRLANKKPFDRAFIDTMIPRHESAIAMAQVAEEETGNPRIREIAKPIASGQQKEISEMKRWRRGWFPGG